MSCNQDIFKKEIAFGGLCNLLLFCGIPSLYNLGFGVLKNKIVQEEQIDLFPKLG
jgi:hypothetical protein